jgi:O-antigen ligase
VFSFLALLMVLRLPQGLVSFVSPGLAGIPALPGGAAGFTLSVYPGGTLETGLLHLGAFYMVWAVSRRGPGVALGVLAVVGALHGVLAAVLWEIGGTTHETVLWVYDLPEVLTPFGTYVNKNHFAGLMIVGAGANLALVAANWKRVTADVSGAGAWVRLARATRSDAWRWVLPGLGFLVCVLLVFASGSRGAALAVAGALAGVAILAGLARRRIQWWPVCLSILLVAGAALVARVGSSDSVLERLMAGGRTMNRPRLWKDTLRMSADHPVFGTGLGTFPYVMPKYQSFDSEREFTHAEGDWIQYLAETGILGALCLLIFAGTLARRLWRGVRCQGGNAGLAFGAAVAFVGLVLHGFVDSSLHIPANFLAASVLAGSILALDGPSGLRSDGPGVQPGGTV